MWECQNCHEQVEDTFDVCWNCGTSRAGAKDLDFLTADQVDPAALRDVPFVKESRPEQTGEPAGGGPSEPYEFSLHHREVISSLATNMKIVGIVAIIGGGLSIMAGCVLIERGGVASLVQGVLGLVIGGLTLQAAGAFREIVARRGNDIRYLMTALEALRSLYRIQVVLLCIAAALLALGFCALVAMQAA